MSFFNFRAVGVITGVVGLVCGSGCPVASDLINPSLLSGLGLDAQTVIAPQGRIVVSFQNQTTSQALFLVSYSEKSAETALAADEFFGLQSGVVEPGEIRNMTLDCPIGLVRPGGPRQGDDAAVLLADGEAAYTGAAVVSGRDFVCGDVIVVRCVQVGTDAVVAVQVQPGR